MEFVDASTQSPTGAVIDNVGLYKRGKDEVMPKEIDAVSAGGIVTMSSIHADNFDMYQLDRILPGVGLNIGAWCPK